MVNSCCSITKLCPAVCDPMDYSMSDLPIPRFTMSRSLPKFISIESVMPSNHLILCHPLLFLPSTFPSIFSNELALCIRWPKCWSFSFSINLSKEYLGLMSFRIDWFGLLGAQGALKGLLQHHSLKSSIIWHSAFFMFHLSHPYMNTAKTIALASQIFVSKVMFLLFNTVYVCYSFLSKKLVSSNFMGSVTIHSDFRAQEEEICHCFHLSICHEVMGPDAIILFIFHF